MLFEPGERKAPAGSSWGRGPGFWEGLCIPGLGNPLINDLFSECHMGYVRCDKKLQMPGLTESLYGNKTCKVKPDNSLYNVLSGVGPLTPTVAVRLGDKCTFLELPLSE